MGKKRVNQLLEQLKATQQADLHNAAAIFTVAQVAVNELRDQAVEASSPVHSARLALPAMPEEMGPPLLSKADLLQRYGSFQGCRQAAKQQGIRFSKTPTWSTLCAAFSYAETVRQLVKRYMEQHPYPDLQGVTVEVSL